MGPTDLDQRARWQALVISIIAALFCFGVAIVVRGASGAVLAMMGVLALGSAIRTYRRGSGPVEP